MQAPTDTCHIWHPLRPRFRSGIRGLFALAPLSSTHPTAVRLTPSRPGSSRALLVSEALLYDLSQQLRLLARRNVVVGSNGRLLKGDLDSSVETLRLRLNSVLWALQDGLNPPDAEATLAQARALVEIHRSTIRDLRRENA